MAGERSLGADCRARQDRQGIGQARLRMPRSQLGRSLGDPVGDRHDIHGSAAIALLATRTASRRFEPM